MSSLASAPLNISLPEKAKYLNKRYSKEFRNSLPFIVASEKGHLNDIETFIKSGTITDIDMIGAGSDGRNYGSTALMYAAQKGHFEIVKTLVQNGADVTAQNKKTYPPLTAISYATSKEVIDYLFDYQLNGATDFESINAVYKASYPWKTPIIIACEIGRLNDVQMFTKSGTIEDINMAGYPSDAERRDIEYTPLGAASTNEHYEIVKHLLSLPDTNVNVGAVYRENPGDIFEVSLRKKLRGLEGEINLTPIFLAATNSKNLNVLNLLLNHKTCSKDVLNKKDAKGRTALDYAKDKNNRPIKNDIIQLLKSKGVKSRETKYTDDDIGTLVFQATKENDVEGLKQLLNEKNADVDVVGNTKYLYTPIQYAARNHKNSVNVLKLLVNHKTCTLSVLNRKNANNWHTALSFAEKYNNGPVKDDIMQLLKSKGAEYDPDNPLHGAVAVEDIEKIKELLTLPHINVGDGHSESDLTALHWACTHTTDKNSLNVLKLLLNHKSCTQSVLNKSVYVQPSYCTPISCAISNEGPIRNDIVELLKSKGAVMSIHEAAAMEDIETLQQLLNEENANVGEKSMHGHTPIHVAAQYTKKNLIFLKLLLNHKTYSIDVLNFCAWDSEEPALTYAKRNRGPLKNDIIQLLISKGAGTLHDAAKYEVIERVKELLNEDNADVGAGGSTSIHYAAQHNKKNLDVLNLLLNHNTCSIDVLNKKNKYIGWCDEGGETALGLAIQNEGPIRKDIIQLLKSKGADISPLILEATKEEDIKSLKQLLSEENADVGAVNGNGSTPIHYAAQYNKKNLDLINCLLNHKTCSIDVLNIKTEQGKTALKLAEDNEGPIRNEIIQLLKSKGAEDEYPLHTAAMIEDIETLKQLLNKENANVDAVDSDGSTALHVAAKNESVQSVSLLLKKGADVDAVDGSLDLFTALHVAAKNESVQTVSLLLEKGADVGAGNWNGSTALHVAADRESLQIVSLLLEKGADVSAVDNDGSTALHQASDNKKNLDVLNCLLNHKTCTRDVVNKKDNNGQTALDFARYSEVPIKNDIIELLRIKSRRKVKIIKNKIKKKGKNNNERV